jgi:hypothetical protein
LEPRAVVLGIAAIVYSIWLLRLTDRETQGAHDVSIATVTSVSRRPRLS